MRIKHILTATIILFLLSFAVSAQSEISLPRDVAEKALRAIELVPALQAENEKLKALIKDLESQKTTPCVSAIYSFTDAYQKLPMPDNSNSKAQNKEILAMRKSVREIWKNSIKGQCNWKSERRWFEYLIAVAPLAAVLLK